MLRGMLYGCFGNVHGLVIVSHGKYFHALLLTVDLKLLDGSRTVDVTGHKKWLSALLLQLSGNLGRSGGLTCALETGHHNDGDLIGGL